MRCRALLVLQLRNAWAIAQVLNRTLVLPDFWSAQDRCAALTIAQRVALSSCPECGGSHGADEEPQATWAVQVLGTAQRQDAGIRAGPAVSGAG